jgi:hypothetical protein
VNDIRGSYATAYVLFNLNGAETKNVGHRDHVARHADPARSVQWDMLANFEKSQGTVVSLPNALPESYVLGHVAVRQRAQRQHAGSCRRARVTGLFYLRNTAGDLLIDPTDAHRYGLHRRQVTNTRSE